MDAWSVSTGGDIHVTAADETAPFVVRRVARKLLGGLDLAAEENQVREGTYCETPTKTGHAFVAVLGFTPTCRGVRTVATDRRFLRHTLTPNWPFSCRCTCS